MPQKFLISLNVGAAQLSVEKSDQIVIQCNSSVANKLLPWTKRYFFESWKKCHIEFERMNILLFFRAQVINTQIKQFLKNHSLILWLLAEYPSEMYSDVRSNINWYVFEERRHFTYVIKIKWHRWSDLWERGYKCAP